MIVKVSGVKRVKARGKLYFYHRKTGQRILAKPNTLAFAAEVERLDGIASKRTAKPGTYLAMAEKFRQSDIWKNLSDLTRRDYNRVISYCCETVRDEDPRDLTKAEAADARDEAAERHGYRFGKLLVQFNRRLWKWAEEYELVDGNPWVISSPARPKDLPDANPPWEPHEIGAVFGHAPIGLARGLALAAMGYRSNDVIAIQWSDYSDGRINYTSSKTNYHALTTVPGFLLPFFEDHPESGPVATTERGAAWKTPNTFTKARRVLVTRLAEKGLCRPDLTTHGLKHTIGRALEETSQDTRTIAAGLQHKSLSMALHYSRRADSRNRSQAVADAFQAWFLENTQKKVENEGED